MSSTRICKCQWQELAHRLVRRYCLKRAKREKEKICHNASDGYFATVTSCSGYQGSLQR
jgi:hypothetical protein